MKIIPIALIIILNSTSSRGQNSPNIFKAIRFKSELGLQRPYRVLKTTCKNLDQFQVYYPETKISLEKHLRFHLHTEIQINQQEFVIINHDSIEARIEDEEKLLALLDSIEHLLEFFEDSRTDPRSGIVTSWYNYNISRNI